MENEDGDDSMKDNNYTDLLNMFIKNFMGGKYSELLSSIIHKIVTGCLKISISLFNGIDRDTCMYIYAFLSKHRYILHVNEDILKQIKDLVQQKFSDLLIYRLNPSIHDLLSNNIYKLDVHGNTCFVPLWMKESYFEVDGYEIMVFCEPELEPNIRIDDKNNIYVEHVIELSELI
jgi:hypothetical protein